MLPLPAPVAVKAVVTVVTVESAEAVAAVVTEVAETVAKRDYTIMKNASSGSEGAFFWFLLSF